MRARLWTKLWRKSWTISIDPTERADRIIPRVLGWGGTTQGMTTVTSEVAHEFVRFCLARRPVGWPLLYDEMCNVASRRLFRGMGYDELREAGVDFTLLGLPLICRLAREAAPTLERAAS